MFATLLTIAFVFHTTALPVARITPVQSDFVRYLEKPFVDCSGNEHSYKYLSWVGDGYCDEKDVDFLCAEFDFDQGDCDEQLEIVCEDSSEKELCISAQKEMITSLEVMQDFDEYFIEL